MLKTLVLGVLTMAMSFFVGISYINAQEATSTPTPTMAEEEDTVDEEEDDNTPSGAPQTGFGN